MIDLSMFQEVEYPLPDIPVRGKPIVGQEVLGILNNKYQFAVPLNLAPANAWAVSPNNAQAAIYTTRFNGLIFNAKWQSTASTCLTYWQWGPGQWAHEVPEE